jgi:hypothetical protein
MKLNKKNLKDLQKNCYADSLKACVIDYALDEDNPKVWFTDLLEHGCQSGMIGGLIYYYDTAKFYDKHYDEIEELREEYEEDFGAPLTIKGDLKNWFAWFAFEETARKIFENDFDLEF